MSGTGLIILAFSSTVNVFGPAGRNLQPDAVPIVLMLLITAAILTGFAMHATAGAKRKVPDGPTLPRLRRNMMGPGERRR